MSDAWDGYRHGRRTRRRKRRWRLALLALVLAAALLLGWRYVLPQGAFDGLAFRADLPADHDDPAALALVIYNGNDPLSRDLADFYAEKRGVPAERVVALACPVEEEISREQYDETIANPLRELFDARHWWTRTPDRPGNEPSSTVTRNAIRFLVLMRGVPLRIRQTAGYAGDASHQQQALIAQANGASVDSELTVLGMFTRAISGFVPNPYFRSYKGIGETNFPGLMLTGRLDAPTGSTVRQMILDSLAAEKTGLWGRCYLDGRGQAPGSGPMAEGDQWIERIANDRAPYFLPTILDRRPEMFSAAYPMTDAAMYFGWYNQDVAGPFAREDFRFAPGAVACHIHSYSATSVRDPIHWWVGPLLNKGAAAVLGNVYEPYLPLTTHLDIFADRLFEGWTLAESAWAATPGLSWMNIVAGDPLYRPGLYWKNQEFNLDGDGTPTGGDSPLAAEGRAYWRGAQLWRAKGPAAGAAALEKSAARLHGGRIFEGLGLLEAAAGDVPHARRAFQSAARNYRDTPDIVRAVLDEAQCLVDHGKRTEGMEVLAAGRRRFADQPAAAAALDEALAAVSPAAVPAKP